MVAYVRRRSPPIPSSAPSSTPAASRAACARRRLHLELDPPLVRQAERLEVGARLAAARSRGRSRGHEREQMRPRRTLRRQARQLTSVLDEPAAADRLGGRPRTFDRRRGVGVAVDEQRRHVKPSSSAVKSAWPAGAGRRGSRAARPAARGRRSTSSARRDRLAAVAAKSVGTPSARNSDDRGERRRHRADDRFVERAQRRADQAARATRSAPCA